LNWESLLLGVLIESRLLCYYVWNESIEPGTACDTQR